MVLWKPIFCGSYMESWRRCPLTVNHCLGSRLEYMNLLRQKNSVNSDKTKLENIHKTWIEICSFLVLCMNDQLEKTNCHLIVIRTSAHKVVLVIQRIKGACTEMNLMPFEFSRITKIL